MRHLTKYRWTWLSYSILLYLCLGLLVTNLAFGTDLPSSIFGERTLHVDSGYSFFCSGCSFCLQYHSEATYHKCFPSSNIHISSKNKVSNGGPNRGSSKRSVFFLELLCGDGLSISKEGLAGTCLEPLSWGSANPEGRVHDACGRTRLRECSDCARALRESN